MSLEAPEFCARARIRRVSHPRQAVGSSPPASRRGLWRSRSSPSPPISSRFGPRRYTPTTTASRPSSRRSASGSTGCPRCSTTCGSVVSTTRQRGRLPRIPRRRRSTDGLLRLLARRRRRSPFRGGSRAAALAPIAGSHRESGRAARARRTAADDRREERAVVRSAGGGAGNATLRRMRDDLLEMALRGLAFARSRGPPPARASREASCGRLSGRDLRAAADGALVLERATVWPVGATAGARLDGDRAAGLARTVKCRRFRGAGAGPRPRASTAPTATSSSPCSATPTIRQ